MKSSLPNKTTGFTLIELIVVIVILGIMAAIAGPKFVNLQTDARISVMKGVEGAVRSAATLAYSKSLIEGEEGNATGSSVSMSGNTVNTVYGYPAGAAGGINLAMDASADINIAYAGGVATFSHALKATCLVTYTQATSSTAAQVNASAVTAANC